MTNEYLEAVDALVDTSPRLELANYGRGPYYRADQRADVRDRADYWTIRRAMDEPHAEAILDAARGTRLAFIAHQDGPVEVEYTAGQYYPREYRAACVRLLASLWWRMQAEAFHDPEWTADDIRKHARRVFGRGIASRWFN